MAALAFLGQCDCCARSNVALTRACVSGIDTFACAAASIIHAAE